MTNPTILFLNVKSLKAIALGKPNYLLGNLNLGAKEVNIIKFLLRSLFLLIGDANPEPFVGVIVEGFPGSS